MSANAPKCSDKIDWTRERPRQFWDPGRKLLKCIRDYQRHKIKRSVFSRLLQKLAVVRHRFWSVVAGADIPLDCQIGGGLLLPHPNGIVIHPKAVIGTNCLMLQQVTLVRAVKVGNNVALNAGVKVVRAVTLGDGAIIGANAVVLRDVPSGTTAVGVPAKIVSSS